MTMIREGAVQSKNKNEELEEENAVDQKSHRSKQSSSRRKTEFPPDVFHPRKPSSQRNMCSDDEEKCLAASLSARRPPQPSGAQFNIASASPSSPGFPAESTLPDK
jgi:hypothetical protein